MARTPWAVQGGLRTGRRRFLRAAAVAAASPWVLPATVLARPGRSGPNSRINLGCVGVGSMGFGHLRAFSAYEDVRVVAICDVRAEHRERAREYLAAHTAEPATPVYNDFREMLARPDLDAVVIAVPDHWHALIGIEAARRGKAMYYEKPMSRTFEEACAVRSAVRRHGVCFQLGTQQRSDGRFRFAVELARSGRLGALQRIVLASAGGGRQETVPIEPAPVPEGLDYDFWLGPAPWVPYTTLRCTRQWTLIRDYSLGCIGGAWGIHHVDIAQWVLDADRSGPVAVEATGVIPDRGLFDTIATWTAEHTYANGVKVIHCDQATARGRFPIIAARPPMGILIEGAEGWVYVTRESIDARPARLLQQVIPPGERLQPFSDDHRRNFLDAVRDGVEPLCGAEQGVRSELVCQQADIAVRLGRRLEWDPVRERFVGDEAANRMLQAGMRSPWHL